MPLTKKEKNFILKNYSELSISKISDITGCSESQIKNFLLTQNLVSKTKTVVGKIKDSIFDQFEYKGARQIFSENLLFWISLFVFIFLLYARSFNSILLSDEMTMYQNLTAGKYRWYDFIFGSAANHIWSFFIFGFTPWGNRLVALILHCINLFLFFTIFRNFISEKILKISLILISVHSLIVEPITWVAANPYTYHTLLYLLIIYSSFLFEKTKKFYFLIPYYLIIINLTISGGHTNFAPILAIVFNLFILKRNLKKEALLSFWLLLLIPVFTVVNKSSVDARVASLTTGPYLEKFIQTLPFTVAKSLEIVSFPFSLALFHEETLTPGYYMFARLLTIFFIGFMIYLFFKKEKIYFGLAGIACAFCIYIFSPIQIAWFVAERYLYFPVFIVCLFMAFLIEYLNRKIKYLGDFYFLTYFFVFLFVTFFRFDAWTDARKLWEENVKVSPDSYRVRNNLAESYLKTSEFDKSIEQSFEAIKRNSNFVQPYFNISTAYLAQNKFSEAEPFLLQTLKIDPTILEAYYRLAIIKANNKDFSAAYTLINKANMVQPNPDRTNKLIEELQKYEKQQKN